MPDCNIVLSAEHYVFANALKAEIASLVICHFSDFGAVCTQIATCTLFLVDGDRLFGTCCRLAF